MSRKKIRIIAMVMAFLMVAGMSTAGTMTGEAAKNYKVKKISFNSKWKYGKCAKITGGKATLYTVTGKNAKGITVCINAGHGTKGGAAVKVLCHPDGSPKIVSGSTLAGATTAPAVGGGMTFNNGTGEATATLKAAKAVKKILLEHGYNVLMIRGKKDVQLDNIARTLIANHYADIHIALHYDGDGLKYDKGAFFCSIPNNKAYKKMEPVKSHWKKHMKLGKCVIKGLTKTGVKKWGKGRMPMDLTQTSFSTIPSIDLELGNQCSDLSSATMKKIAKGIRIGVDKYFAKKNRK